MIDFINTTQMTDRVVASCLLASRTEGTAVSGFVAAGSGERQAKGFAVTAAAAQNAAYAQPFAAALPLAAAEFGVRSEKTKHNPKWAFRGLEPWRDPA